MYPTLEPAAVAGNPVFVAANDILQPLETPKTTSKNTLASYPIPYP